MSLPNFPILPDSTGYRVVHPNNIIATDLPGGLARQRVDVLGGVGTVDVQWTCDPLEYDFITAFKRSCEAPGGSLQFTIDLIMDSDNAQAYTAQFVPGTFGLKSQIGLTYIVGATLQVAPLVVNTSFDQSLVDLYSTYLGGSSALLAAISTLVNIEFPSTL